MTREKRWSQTTGTVGPPKGSRSDQAEGEHQGYGAQCDEPGAMTSDDCSAGRTWNTDMHQAGWETRALALWVKEGSVLSQHRFLWGRWRLFSWMLLVVAQHREPTNH